MIKSTTASTEASTNSFSNGDFFTSLRVGVSDDSFWSSYLAPLWEQSSPNALLDCSLYFSLHLAVFVEPYLKFVIEGSKTIESRFSSRKIAPYKCVEEGDVVLLKRSGGPVSGICKVTNVWFYELDSGSLKEIRDQFAKPLRAQDPEFWSQREHAEFATLIQISQVLKIDSIPFMKKDRRGWVVVKRGKSTSNAPLSYEKKGLFADG